MPLSVLAVGADEPACGVQLSIRPKLGLNAYMSSFVMRESQPIVIGVDDALGVALGVDDALGVPLADALLVPVGVGEGVGTQPLRAASASAETAIATTARLETTRGATRGA